MNYLTMQANSFIRISMLLQYNFHLDSWVIIIWDYRFDIASEGIYCIATGQKCLDN